MRKKILLFLLVFANLSAEAEISGKTLIRDALDKHLFERSAWKGLIHATVDNRPSINDPSFLLSYPEFTPEKELIATINALYDDNHQTAAKFRCKYPARYLWLQQELNIAAPVKFDGSNTCRELKQYFEKTSYDTISLIYVSENVADPASMMGHVFFKISGKNERGEMRAHAVSFYTVIDTVNLPKLLVKSLITGMNGYFSLQPYKEVVYRYNVLENRNVWEYALSLSEKQKRLLYYHFWELKDIKLKYLFAGYNCATIIDDMLYIVNDKNSRQRFFWVTPKDVVKKVNKAGLVKKSNLLPSDMWYLKMLLNEIPDEKKEKILEIFRHKSYENIKNFQFSEVPSQRMIEKELFSQYARYLYHHQKIGEDEYREAMQLMSRLHISTKNYQFDISQYKNPLKTNNDSRMELGYGKNNTWFFTFLPASNTLTSDNREYFGETSLQIGEVRLRMKNDTLKIDNFNLYCMSSLIPWDSFTNPLSKDFCLNYEKHYDKNLHSYHAWNISFGLGASKQISEDILVFSLLHLGLAYGDRRVYAYTYPEAGFMMYEIFNMKTTFRYKYLYNQDDSKSGYHDVSFVQSLFLNKKHNIEFSVENQYNGDDSNQNYILSYVHYF